MEKAITSKRWIIPLALLALSGFLLIGLQWMPWAWLFLCGFFISALFMEKSFRQHLLLLGAALTILGVTQITTDISWSHMASMGALLILAVTVPYFVSRFVLKKRLVTFPFHHGRKWFRSEVIYVVFTIVLAYFILPIYLRSTGAYLNWSVEPGWSNMIRLFLGTQLLGLWDELFFVSTMLGTLRKFVPFWPANITMSVVFVSFLYELGFTGWATFILFPFALIQGYVFRKTESLLYVISIHLALDVVLFLALVNAHHSYWIRIFIT